MRIQELKVGDVLQCGEHRITRLANHNGKVRIGIEGPGGARYVADVEGPIADAEAETVPMKGIAEPKLSAA